MYKDVIYMVIRTKEREVIEEYWGKNFGTLLKLSW